MELQRVFQINPIYFYIYFFLVFEQMTDAILERTYSS